MEAKLNFLHWFFENIDFLKISQNHRKTYGFHWFLEVRPSKKRSKNDAETQLKKTLEKYLFRIDFDLHFNLRNLPKSLQNRPGTRKNGGLDEACFATLCKSRGSRRKLTGLSVCKASKWLRIWLGLLHPLICPSSPSSSKQGSSYAFEGRFAKSPKVYTSSHKVFGCL